MVDRLRDDVWKNHPQINIVDFDFYNMEIFNHCEEKNDVLLAIKNWENVHPLIRIIPIDWTYEIPFGLLYSGNPSEKVKRLLAATKKVIDSNQ